MKQQSKNLSKRLGFLSQFNFEVLKNHSMGLLKISVSIYKRKMITPRISRGEGDQPYFAHFINASFSPEKSHLNWINRSTYGNKGPPSDLTRQIGYELDFNWGKQTDIRLDILLRSGTRYSNQTTIQNFKAKRSLWIWLLVDLTLILKTNYSRWTVARKEQIDHIKPSSTYVNDR